MRGFESALKGPGKDATIVVYEGADHAFANLPDRDFEREAAAQAWHETVRSLASHLASGS